jgi:hypothetical protein
MDHITFQTLIIGLLGEFINSTEGLALQQGKIEIIRKTINGNFPFVEIKLMVFSQHQTKRLDLTFYKKNGKLTTFWVAEKDFGKIHLRIVYNEQFRTFVVKMTSDGNIRSYIRDL